MGFVEDNLGIFIFLAGVLIILFSIKIEIEAKTRRLKKTLKK